MSELTRATKLQETLLHNTGLTTCPSTDFWISSTGLLRSNRNRNDSWGSRLIVLVNAVDFSGVVDLLGMRKSSSISVADGEFGLELGTEAMLPPLPSDSIEE